MPEYRLGDALFALLKGDALLFAQTLPSKVRTDYAALKHAMSEEFAVQQAHQAQAQLTHIEWNPDTEYLNSFMLRLTRLVQLAFPEYDSATYAPVIRLHLVRAIPQSILRLASAVHTENDLTEIRRLLTGAEATYRSRTHKYPAPKTHPKSRSIHNLTQDSDPSPSVSEPDDYDYVPPTTEINANTKKEPTPPSDPLLTTLQKLTERVEQLDKKDGRNAIENSRRRFRSPPAAL